jgi:hypothetical protein
MKILLTVLAFINGGYMLADGIYVILKGKYIGPAKPGPWSDIFNKLGIDAFKLGPVFIAYGLVWLVFAFGLWTSQGWAYWLGLVISFCTLWYLPVGTLISLIILILLLIFRSRLGL